MLIHSTNTYLSGIIHRNYKKKKKELSGSTQLTEEEVHSNIYLLSR